MLESKMLARLRAVREMFGRTGEGDESETEGGFTLIELMVVLLIMGILLAIAIPTFLSVTGGAKKTSAQQNLTNAMTSATANYTNNDASFPTKTAPNTATVTTTKLETALGTTQASITFMGAQHSPARGKNVIGVDEVNKNVVVFTAVDGDGFCWVGALNETSTPYRTGVHSPGAVIHRHNECHHSRYNPRDMHAGQIRTQEEHEGELRHNQDTCELTDTLSEYAKGPRVGGAPLLYPYSFSPAFLPRKLSAAPVGTWAVPWSQYNGFRCALRQGLEAQAASNTRGC